jgi:hypothetical protein
MEKFQVQNAKDDQGYVDKTGTEAKKSTGHENENLSAGSPTGREHYWAAPADRSRWMEYGSENCGFDCVTEGHIRQHMWHSRMFPWFLNEW